MRILEITIDGSRIRDQRTFYEEIDRVLTKDLTWTTGHNLDAFSDLLAGGFGVFEQDDRIQLVWNHFEVSSAALGTQFTNAILNIFKEHPHIEFTSQG